jgi:SAM-dependent methyltransferase
VRRNDLADRLARLYGSRSLQGYVRWKVRADPAYGAVAAALAGRDRPVVDLGCGVGLLPFFLRESGFTAPIIGVDFDERKIDLARQAATRYRGIDFVRGDARDPLPEGHDVIMLDILQYFRRSAQPEVMENVARTISSGGVVVMRQGIADGSWRHRFTLFVDAIGRAIRWNRGEGVEFPTRQEIVTAFDGFDAEITPLWGGMPYNNYLFVFTKR